jgi:hypothetical protein
MRREQGFSLLELIVAMGVMLTVTASVFTLMNPTHGSFSAQPEVSDMQQRLRVATDTLYKDLVMTGAGAYQGGMGGSLGNFFASVHPRRVGSTLEDAPTVFKTDTITLIYVPPTIAQTTLVNPGPSLNSAEIRVAANATVPPSPGCPAGDDLCGFVEGMTVLMYDDSGNYDVFTITNVQDSALHLQHNSDKLTYTGYNDSTKIVQAANLVYYLNAATNQLMFYGGGTAPDVPIADNVVGLSFEYYGDPQPPAWRPGKNVMAVEPGPWTTYGPKPASTAVNPWVAGENCIFTFDGVTPQSRLPALGAAGSGLVKLTAAQLTDGPWCPRVTSENRWDADLLRVRKIVATVRVQAAAAALRGPASALFRTAGTSRTTEMWVPDQEVRFEVSPRNLNLGR